jgi:hypothetical protein
VFRPKYAACLNLIEPEWKTLKSLAIKGRFSRTWEQVGETITRAVGYWNGHRYPYVWERRLHRPARRLSIGAMPTVPAMIG